MSSSGSDFLTSYGSGYGSGSTNQKVTVPKVPVPVPQHWFNVFDGKTISKTTLKHVLVTALTTNTRGLNTAYRVEGWCVVLLVLVGVVGVDRVRHVSRDQVGVPANSRRSYFAFGSFY